MDVMKARVRRPARTVRGPALIVSGLVGHDGSHELRERFPDSLFRDLAIAKGTREEHRARLDPTVRRLLH